MKKTKMVMSITNLFEKAVLLMAVAVMCVFGADAVQDGDMVGEDSEVFFSETDRITVDEVEYLYTFKGVRHYQNIATNVVEYSNGTYGYNTYPKYGAVETQFVIEKATPLTGNYEVTINVGNLLHAFGYTEGHESFYYSFGTWDGSTWGTPGYFQTNFYYTAASTIVIGDSCFEGNELVESVSIVPEDGVRRNLRIAKRSFYGAVNLGSVSVCVNSWSGDQDPAELFRNLQLKSIGESAFEGCVKLGGIQCSCDELERIDVRAFNGCYYFSGIDSDFEGYHWYTPKLSYIGDYAFYDAGKWCNQESIKWTFEDSGLEIGDSAFYSCGFLQEIHFPTNMERIKERCFVGLHGYYGESATQLYFPDSLALIDSHAFEGSHVQVMQWPSSLQEIGDSAFGNTSVRIDYSVNLERTAVCSSLVYDWANGNGLPSTLVKLGNNAFCGSCTAGANTVPEWSNGKISYLRYSATAINSCGPLSGTIFYPTNLTSVPSWGFARNVLLEQVVLHGSVTNIGSSAFAGCSGLSLIVPGSVREVGERSGGSSSFYYNYKEYTIPGVKSVVFEGKPPKGIIKSGFLECSNVMVSAEYANDWAPYMNSNVKLAKRIDGVWTALGGKVVSSAMRASDPTIMDITYKVTSTKDRVNVRLLAFKNGTMSFANVLRPETFVDGTGANLGDNVAANVEHTVSWKVSSDWDVDLAKVSVAVYVKEDDLLPLLLTTIPATANHVSVTFSRNAPSEDMVKNALFWLYADGASDLTLANGVLLSDGTQLASGTTLSAVNAVSYLYSKMGYGTLSGATLSYVNSITRQNLSPSGINQYAVKEGGE